MIVCAGLPTPQLSHDYETHLTLWVKEDTGSVHSFVAVARRIRPGGARDSSRGRKPPEKIDIGTSPGRGDRTCEGNAHFCRPLYDQYRHTFHHRKDASSSSFLFASFSLWMVVEM